MKSMTGYASIENVGKSCKVKVETKSLNSKYLSLDLSIPPFLSPYEIHIHNTVRKYVRRGKIQIRVRVVFLEPPKGITVDFGLLRSYHEALESINAALSLPEPVKLEDLLRFKDIIRFDISEEDLEEVWNVVEPTLEKALEKLVEDRKREGEKLKRDLLSILDDLEEKITRIEESSQNLPILYREKLMENFEEILPNNVDVNMKIFENALAVSLIKADIREEIARLKSHHQKARKLLENDDSVGLHLDFLAQEFLREFNTILAKSILKEITDAALEGKILVSQFREQVQNVE
ncbi:MAG: YicC family protein [Thermotogae bacterium]|nr:MAG: YicC family protein [Thermotogota bacterium]